MGVIDSLVGRLGSNPEFTAWLQGLRNGRGVPNWTGTTSPKLGGYPGRQPGMPLAPGNSPGGPRLGGSYTPRGLGPDGTPNLVPAPNGSPFTNGGSLAPASPFEATMGRPPGAGAPPPVPGNTPAPGMSGAPSAGPNWGGPPQTVNLGGGSPLAPLPTNRSLVPAGGNPPPAVIPPAAAPAARFPWGSAALAGGTAAAVGSALTNGPSGNGGGPVDPQNAPHGMGPVNVFGPQGPQFGPPTPGPQYGPNRPPVPMPTPRPPNLSGGLPSAPMGPDPSMQYQDPGAFNGLGRGPAGSGSPDLPPDLLRKLLQMRNGSLNG